MLCVLRVHHGGGLYTHLLWSRARGGGVRCSGSAARRSVGIEVVECMYVELETTTAPGQPTLQMLIVVGCVCCKKGPAPEGAIKVHPSPNLHPIVRPPNLRIACTILPSSCVQLALALALASLHDSEDGTPLPPYHRYAADYP